MINNRYVKPIDNEGELKNMQKKESIKRMGSYRKLDIKTAIEILRKEIQCKLDEIEKLELEFRLADNDLTKLKLQGENSETIEKKYKAIFHEISRLKSDRVVHIYFKGTPTEKVREVRRIIHRNRIMSVQKKLNALNEKQDELYDSSIEEVISPMAKRLSVLVEDFLKNNNRLMKESEKLTKSIESDAIFLDNEFGLSYSTRGVKGIPNHQLCKAILEKLELSLYHYLDIDERFIHM